MYLDRVQKAFEEHYEVEETAAALWNETVKKLERDYGNVGRVYTEKYEEGKALYDATIAASREKGIAIVKEEFAKLGDIVREFVTSPVPDGFAATLEAIKVVGEGITEAEAEVYLEKYKNNYMACLSLSQCFQNQTGRRYYVARYDAIKNDIAEYEGYAVDYFDNHASGIFKALYASPEQSPVMKFDVVLQNFIKNDVRSYESLTVTE